MEEKCCFISHEQHQGELNTDTFKFCKGSGGEEVQQQLFSLLLWNHCSVGDPVWMKNPLVGPVQTRTRSRKKTSESMMRPWSQWSGDQNQIPEEAEDQRGEYLHGLFELAGEP